MIRCENSGAAARLSSVTAPGFQFQLVSLAHGVIVDVQGWAYDVFGRAEQGHVVARLDLAEARHLAHALSDAITAALDLPGSHKCESIPLSFGL
jgi:hypothetical protein